MFRLKEGVNARATIPIWYAIGVADALYNVMFGGTLIVTSMKDGTHEQDSLHHWQHPDDELLAEAVDLRDRNLTEEQSKRFYLALKRVLPAGYDIVLETNPRHVHIEWQPKEGEQGFLVTESTGGSNELAQH